MKGYKITEDTPVCVLGGGLSGLAFTYFTGLKAVIFEKEDRLGGLCRSFSKEGINYDIGPHICFSKNKTTLEFLKSLTSMHQSRRSNKIFYKGRYIKYPFENELSSLPDKERNWCLQSFLHNPYTDYDAQNMLMFFYGLFGEGITRTYLEPYNRKIWKFEPSFLDMQMVERIPKPPPEDIIKSAQGIQTEGYLHQLFFWYPDFGGIESLIGGLSECCHGRVETYLNSPLEHLRVKSDGTYQVTAAGKTHSFEKVVTTMPVHELVPRIEPSPPQDVQLALDEMKYNSIFITLVNTREETIGSNFAVMVPDPDIGFHRISKIDFLGESYRIPDTSTLMAEITFRKGGRFDLPDDDISGMVMTDIERLGFSSIKAVNFVETRGFQYAYIIYDLKHRKNTDKVLAWLKSLGILSVGRFATFEYINTDKVIELARKAANSFIVQNLSQK